MKASSLLIGGLLSGLGIVLGEAVLNMLVLADDWAQLIARLALPMPGISATLQAIAKLLLLGIFIVWLADALRPRFSAAWRAALASGLIVWLLVWAWVQWGMLLSGYVTPGIASMTVLWGLVELPACALLGWWGTRFAPNFHSTAARSS